MNQTDIDRLKSIQLFLLDLDGTVYLHTTPIPGALEFINYLNLSGIGYLFLTNNSSRSAFEYVKKLSGMGFPVTREHVLTSGQVTGWYLENKKPGATIYVVGTESLKTELASYDLTLTENANTVDYVVVGYDTELNYNKLCKACDYLRGDAVFIATNPDLVCPMGNNRYLPDCGSMCQLIENTVKKQPIYIGKPHTKMIDYLRAQRAISRSAVAMIGDRLYTDIALGCNAGIMSVCTLTGESDRLSIKKSDYQPDLIIESIAELLPILQS